MDAVKLLRSVDPAKYKQLFIQQHLDYMLLSVPIHFNADLVTVSSRDSFNSLQCTILNVMPIQVGILVS